MTYSMQNVLNINARDGLPDGGLPRDAEVYDIIWSEINMKNSRIYTCYLPLVVGAAFVAGITPESMH